MRQHLRTRPTLLGAALVGAALSGALPSAAANVLNNGTFGSGLGGWAATPSVEWAPEGAAGPGSGSARIRGNPGIVGALMLSQCAAVTPGTDYDLGATTLLPSSPEAEGGVSFRVVWHSWPGCEGATLGLSPALDFPHVAPAVWTRRSLERLRAPSGAASASVQVVPWASGPELALRSVRRRRGALPLEQVRHAHGTDRGLRRRGSRGALPDDPRPDEPRPLHPARRRHPPLPRRTSPARPRR